MPKKDFGMKFSTDGDKLDWTLLPWDSVEEVLKTLHYGATKYEARNWEKGNSYNKYYAAAMRHMMAWHMGQDFDEGESELHHLAQASFNLLALLAWQMRGVGEDDRPNYHKVINTPTAQELTDRAEAYKAKRNNKG